MGCGAFMNGFETGGHWNDFHKDYHINVTEILAVQFVLQLLCLNFKK